LARIAQWMHIEKEFDIKDCEGEVAQELAMMGME
jgi:hypothetical protein